ncbi:MAG: NAD(P)-dependent oxidoreductase [Phycisphaerales bacterium]|nr:NAD(P)-dependent oxidoreductase [Phycisphaerales bacterium]
MSHQATAKKKKNEKQSSEQAVVLLADAFSDIGIKTLETLGCKVVFDASLKDDDLVESIKVVEPTVTIVRSTKITPAMLRGSSKLGVIVRAGAGYDTIDVEAASELGIFVANCPGKNSVAVAELAWGLILSCDRRLPDQVADLRNGKWRKKEYSKAPGLCGRTLGIVGLGGIGIEVAKRGQAFGMSVLAWSRSLSEAKAEKLGIGWCENLHDLAGASDVVTIHLASTQDTKHLIAESFLNAMKDGATLINTSRGNIVDETALQNAVINKGLSVGLDVYQEEPTAGDSEFDPKIISCDKVYGTHHVGASTLQAQEAIAEEAIRIVQRYLSDGVVHNCVNRATSTSARAMISVRHRNLPGVLAYIFEIMSQEGVNVEEMENIIYQGAQAACARMQLDRVLSQESVALMRESEHVLSVTTTIISQ